MENKISNGVKLKPLHDHLVIKPAKAEEQTKSGIVLPGTVSKERPEQGKVVAIGSGRLLDNGQTAPLTVKVGDEVMFKKYSPDEIKIDDEEFLVIKESDILAIIE